MLELYNAKVRRERDIPAALICATLANCNRNSEEHPDPFTYEDFLLRSEDELAEREDDAELAAAEAARESAKMEHKVRWMEAIHAGPGPLARKAKI